MTDPQTWHWTEGGRPAGPGTLDALAAVVAAGRVTANDPVWTDGMADWAAVRDVPAVARYLPAVWPGQSTDPLGYYSTGGRLPPRAAAALAGDAPPTGDVGDWPLDDARVAQLVDAARARKRVTDGARLCRLLCWLSLSFAGLGVLGGFTSRRSGSSVLAGAVILVGFGGGLAVLFHVAAAATRRAKRWGVLTTLVLSLTTAATVVAVGVGHAVSTPGRPNALAVGIPTAVCLAFAAVAWRSAAAVAAYRRQPAWCQELLVRVERRR